MVNVVGLSDAHTYDDEGEDRPKMKRTEEETRSDNKKSARKLFLFLFSPFYSRHFPCMKTETIREVFMMVIGEADFLALLYRLIKYGKPHPDFPNYYSYSFSFCRACGKK